MGLTDNLLTDFTVEQLGEAFDLVADAADWRAPIDWTGVLPEHISAEMVADAIDFYTATFATIEVFDAQTTRIRAAGYRMGPAGP